EGGEPVRLTWHPDIDVVAEWYPDGKSILIRSRRASAIQRFDRFFQVPAAGGFERLLPLPTGGYASLSPDGNRLAFVSPSYDNRTWKRYRGGNAPDIWIYDFKANSSEKITDWEGPDEWPMWHDHASYYCSDRKDRRHNVVAPPLSPRPASHSPFPAWSPDGRWIPCLSDQGGEYELHVIGSDGKTPDRQVTRGGATFRFPPRWSPDSKKLAFSDKTRTL